MKLSVLASLALVSITNAAYAGDHPTAMDADMRLALCTNQQALCLTSCSNKAKGNSCNVETLEWTCVCADGTDKLVSEWYFPIPFKLCKKELWSCVQQCASVGRFETAMDDQSPQQIPEHQQKPLLLPLSPSDQRNEQEGDFGALTYSNHDDDYDQDDWDAIEELHALKLRARLEGTSYSRFEKHYDELLLLSKNGDKQHQLFWKDRLTGADTKSSVVNKDPSIPVGSSVNREAACVERCQSQFECGTENAPKFNGIRRV